MKKVPKYVYVMVGKNSKQIYFVYLRKPKKPIHSILQLVRAELLLTE